MGNDLWRLSACETAAGIKEKHFTAEAVVHSVAERIKTENPRLNAIVLDLTEQAFAQAREADRQIADGEDVGPLHGVPVTIKSNVDVEGQPT
ncbi:MAG: amidase family protein, partial [Pseudomonadota bacterium]